MSALESQSKMIGDFGRTRAATMNLVKTLERDDYTVQTASYTSPPKWHIGHTSWIYEAIISKIIPEYEFYSEEFSGYLNSYYQQFGRPHSKSERGIVSRPTLDQIIEYTKEVDKRVVDTIKSKSLDEKAARLLSTGIHHECQHQELLVYDLQHMLAERYVPWKKSESPVADTAGVREPVRIRGGMYDIGYSGRNFCYDVELPEHRRYLEDYLIDVYPVTCGEYAAFVADGGYESYKYWLADGWEKVGELGWRAPMYWEESGDGWYVRDFAGVRPIDAAEPVCNVSYYEASAYCKWAGKRLPTEAEWEVAAAYDSEKRTKLEYPWGMQGANPSSANLLESYVWKPSRIGSYPSGASPCGCEQMIGDVWEWTSSEFAGYPGFRSDFEEYNDKWFANQKVLRGGSFATPGMSVRASYRNFFRPDERWMFAGFRCAYDP